MLSEVAGGEHVLAYSCSRGCAQGSAAVGQDGHLKSPRPVVLSMKPCDAGVQPHCAFSERHSKQNRYPHLWQEPSHAEAAWA